MRASQNVTRRIDDLVQSNHSIPNGPHVRPLTSFRSNSKRHVNINPSSGLFSSPHRIPTVSSAFSGKKKRRNRMFFLALGTSSFPKHIVISVMVLFLAPRLKIFSKNSCHYCNVGFGTRDCAFRKTIFAKADVSFSRKDSARLSHVLCGAVKRTYFENQSLPLAILLFPASRSGNTTKHIALSSPCSFWR
jgi:hypothetical protein